MVKPDMHKTVLVYNSDYKLVPETVTVVEKETIPVMEAPAKPVQTTTKVEKKFEEVKTQTNVQTNKTSTPKQTVKKTETKVQKTETPKTTTVIKQEQKKTEPQIAQTVTKTSTPTVKQIQQEEIAWNIWRSNLQNKIMQDVYLPEIPNGTVFKFSFNVDKYGRVTNVQTWSTTPTYTPYAIQYIAPVIRSYQGKSILNFPSGSTRETTEVKGGWRISSNEKFSTPQDYHDIEKVVR